MPVRFQIDVKKTVQAIGVLLRRLERDRLEYISIIKLLYLADREAWAEAGLSITGDVPIAMENGPVLSHLYDLIKHQTDEGLDLWVKHFRKKDYDLVMVNDPDQGRLSKFEVEKLHAIADTHGRKSWRELIELTHQLPEWQENNPLLRGVNVYPIALEDILRAVGREDVQDVLEDAEEFASVRSRSH